MGNKIKHIVFLGLSGFPIGMAAIQRQKLLAKALINAGWTITIVCPRSVHNKNRKIPKIGHLDGINYIYLYNPIRSGSFLIRSLQKLFAPILEMFLLIRLKIKFGINIGIVSNRNLFLSDFKYAFISYLLNFKLLLNLVEIYDKRNETNFKLRINDLFFNKFGVLLFDAVLPISDYIIKNYLLNKKKYLYIPILVDPSEFKLNGKKIVQEKYFLFCGAASYFNSIELIISAFKSINEKNIKLILVTNGSSSEIRRIKDVLVYQSLVEHVQVKSNISYEELINLYSSATALLLPLFNSIQDNARFPHKLAEYLASGRPVISNPVGEIVNYLVHLQNVVFAEVANPIDFGFKMKWILENENEATTIGLNGKRECIKHFDYHLITQKLNSFLEENI